MWRLSFLRPVLLCARLLDGILTGGDYQICDAEGQGVSEILDGIRVLDFGRYIAAPFCCQLLADMGAEVIRVERPGGEPDRSRGPFAANGQSLYFIALNRNKKAITLNLNSPRGRE
ncbi:MAG: CoA transferase, partial [Candidatus Binataceae bacterium]